MILPGLAHATVPTPVTFAPVPAFLGPAVIALPLGQVEDDVNEPEPPAQMVTPVVTGVGFTVTIDEAVLLHPLASVPVTV